MKPPSLERRAIHVLLCIAVAHTALVATHGGEFWPFSIYPMFSAAGRPWGRALVHATGNAIATSQLGVASSLARLPGAPLGLHEYGIDQNDLSSLVQRAEQWGTPDLATLKKLFGLLPCERPLLISRVRGALATDAVEQLATPVASLTCDDAEVTVHVPAR